PPPSSAAVLPLTVQPVSVTTLAPMPPPLPVMPWAALLLTVQLVSVAAVAQTPPPKTTAELPLRVQLVSVAVPAKRPPPSEPATLRRTALSLTVSTPPSPTTKMPPPLPLVALRATVVWTSVTSPPRVPRSPTCVAMPPPSPNPRFPTPAQPRTTRSALTTRIPPPTLVVFPPRTVSPWNATRIELGAVPSTSNTRSFCWPSTTVRPAPAP